MQGCVGSADHVPDEASSATTRRRSRPIASPVLGFTSNRGKFELDTSSRMWCPDMNRLLVG
jgi:hypothetical protein